MLVPKVYKPYKTNDHSSKSNENLKKVDRAMFTEKLHFLKKTSKNDKTAIINLNVFSSLNICM